MSEVLAMLEQDRRDDTLLDRGVGGLASAMFDGSQPPPGTMIGRYRVKGVLGEGGMGVVCLAEREDLGNLVAVKVLRDARLSPARRARFAAEQRMLAQLNHPGIARLYDADTLPDGTPWLAMEYVDGLPLTDYCRTHRSDIRRRLQLFRQACEAVRYAHAHAIIHRDIKPSNVLVKQDGGVRLLDFGIAKQLDGLESGGDRTRTMLRLMTPAYAAPEQLLGKSVGIHTDVYSLGVMLHELLTGRLPFELGNLSAAEAAAVLSGHEPPKPSQVVPQGEDSARSISKAEWADLDILCLTAMHADPARRYSSVEALIRDIDHFLGSEPLEARPDRWSYRAGKFLRRHWQVAGVAACALILIAGLSLLFMLRLTRARDAALAEAQRTQRVQQLMTRVFQGGDELAGPGDAVRVVDVLDRGAREAQALSADPVVQADLLFHLAGIYQQLGRHDKADGLFQTSLQQRRALSGTDSAEVAETLVAIGELRIDQARLGDAEELIRQGFEMAARHLAPDHPKRIAATLAMSRVLRERGNNDRSINVLTELARQQSVRQTAPIDRAAVLSELADAHYSAGHYPESEKLRREVLGLHRHELGSAHPVIAADLGSLAAIQQDLGYYERAEQLAREALAIDAAYYGADSTHVAGDLTSVGRALTYGKKYDEAVEVLERALRIQETVHGPSHPVVAEAVNELGNVLAMHDRLDEAEMRFRRTAAIYERVYGQHHYLLAIARSNVANVYMLKKDYKSAEVLFRDVIGLFTETLSATNVNTGIARIKLGRTLLRAQRPAEAVQETLAGYEVLAGQTSPSISYLRAARTDLVAAYEALGSSEQAQRFRAELLAMDRP
ncbi:MAG: serine/threonine-protein kinase [Steroidobacteraceae bacterium]